jgi:hypothetical protein
VVVVVGATVDVVVDVDGDVEEGDVAGDEIATVVVVDAGGSVEFDAVLRVTMNTTTAIAKATATT